MKNNPVRVVMAGLLNYIDFRKLAFSWPFSYLKEMLGREAQGNIRVQIKCDSGASFIWCFEELWNRLHVSLASKSEGKMYQILENNGICRGKGSGIRENNKRRHWGGDPDALECEETFSTIRTERRCGAVFLLLASPIPIRAAAGTCFSCSIAPFL
jgi:hypothetical protein